MTRHARRGRARGPVAVLAVLAALVAGAVPATTAALAADCPRTTLAEIEAQVMCPVCGTPLALASEAPQAERQRALIQRLVDRCRSEEQIKAVLVAEFGDDVLALPDPAGFDLAAYVVPALALGLAALAAALAARRWRRGRPGAAGPGPAEDPAAARRLDADLDRYEL